MVNVCHVCENNEIDDSLNDEGIVFLFSLSNCYQ